MEKIKKIIQRNQRSLISIKLIALTILYMFLNEQIYTESLDFVYLAFFVWICTEYFRVKKHVF